MDIRCSREGTKCDGCPIMKECERVELTEEVDLFKIYNQALEDVITKVKEHHYLLSDKINSTDYGMFTCGIEQIVDELKR